MTIFDWIQIWLYLAVLLLLVKPLGAYVSHIFQGGHTFMSPIVGPMERSVYRILDMRADEAMDWKKYAIALLLFTLMGIISLYALERLQSVLPLNPQNLGAVKPDLALFRKLS